MRIVFVLPRYHTNLHNWIHKHLQEGDEVKVILYHNLKRNTNSPVVPDLIPWSRLTTLIKHCHPSFSILRYGIPNIRFLKNHLKSFYPDLIIVRDPGRMFSVVTILLAFLLGLRFVMYTQSPLYTRYGIVKKLLISFISVMLKSALVTPVKGEKVRRKAAKRFYYLPFVMDTKIPKRSRNTYHGGKVLMIGKYVPRKNHLLLLDAISEINAELRIKLTMIGATTGQGLEKYKQRVTAYINENEMQSYVEQKEIMTYDKLQRFYREFDLFVLPSRDEEVGVSVLEAMANGLPVICSDTAGASDFIRQEQNGFVFKSDDKESLKQAIQYCLHDKLRTIAMGEKSRQIVQTYYSPNLYYKRIQLLTEKIIG